MNSLFELLLYLLAGHFIGDFAFQADWIAQRKGKSWEINLYHALIYTATIVFAAAFGAMVTTEGGTGISYGAMILIALSHFIIDPLKARWGIVKYIWLDQLLHIAVLIIAIFIP